MFSTLQERKVLVVSSNTGCSKLLVAALICLEAARPSQETPTPSLPIETALGPTDQVKNEGRKALQLAKRTLWQTDTSK